jgi:chromosome segregation ATPase
MTWNDHDHRGDYADARHDHDGDYAEKHHSHYDLEREIEALRRELRDYRQALNEYESDLADARSRVRSLEQQTPQARQLQLEADQAAADLAESGYDRHGRDCRCSYCSCDPEEAR